MQVKVIAAGPVLPFGDKIIISGFARFTPLAMIPLSNSPVNRLAGHRRREAERAPIEGFPQDSTHAPASFAAGTQHPAR
jgi:hypothetical protein